ncbi:hypothetical protein V5O48_009463 [Marasmius crinis-equi]|uniref:F-box domain-containing protein n=1 Tax=Marasmius crinis-equi TaxID=585013 RepID=A0ABR3FB69_9AGAR
MELERTGYFYGYPRPYMRLYEDAEDSFRLYQMKHDDRKTRPHDREQPVEVTLDADESQSPWDDLDAYRMYHAMRLFDSLAGFYTGKLDLTGRHLQRYNDLKSTFLELTDDLAAVAITVREERYRDVDWDGKVKNFVNHVMTDEERWKAFRIKWKTPRLVDYGWLQNRIAILEDAVRNAKGKYKIQKLCIMDLPPELIDHIFSFASLSQARLLASTCKTMKSIGVPHLYHTRSVKLGFPDRENVVRMVCEPAEVAEETVDGLFIEQSNELIRQVDFLIGRPDLTEAITNLSVTDDWKAETYSFSQVFRQFRRNSSTYIPISTSINSLLTSCRSLTHLSICHFTATSDWFRAMSQLSKLHTLRLQCTLIEDQSVEADILHRRIPRSPQVLNLNWYERDNEADEPPSRESGGRGVWFALLLFPNLITFNQRMFQSVSWLPPPAIRARATHFSRGLRRLSLNLPTGLVPVLTDWFLEARLRTQASCTLTHFKLRTDRPLADDAIIELLETIQSAPLEVLVLEGIKEGSLTLIERIAQLFPDLLGLTLIRRENKMQQRTKLVPWPYQTGDYASRLRGFRRLKYFGWNFWLSVFEPTPSVLLQFEASTSATSTEGEEGERLWYDELDEYFEDPGCFALSLGCQCPTLETVGLEDGICQHYAISRGSHMEVKANGGLFGGSSIEDPQDWNPSKFSSGWKAIIPLVSESGRR